MDHETIKKNLRNTLEYLKKKSEIFSAVPHI